MKNLIVSALIMFFGFTAYGQKETTEIDFTISIVEEINTSFKSDGRLFIYLSDSDKREPRYSGDIIFGMNIKGWDKAEKIYLDGNDEWTKTPEWNFHTIPQGEYYIQVVWKQNSESRSNTPGNLYSEAINIRVKEKQTIVVSLSKIIPERSVIDNSLVKMFSMNSEILSKWWDKPISLKASVLLPSGYESNPVKNFPVRYNIGGIGARYTRVNRLVNDSIFMNWWTTKEAPQIITVFLDGEGPFGDCYQLDSDNNGPYGEALIKELIPSIEKQFRIVGTSETRFVDGCSTGGWVSLALQLFYPNQFNGCWSYSPDPVDFRKLQLINIYEDKNAFYNDANYLIPSMRDIYGDPKFSIKWEVTSENVQGYSDTYVTSGKQWGAWNALFSPKGSDGLPKPLFDAETGSIDSTTAANWKRYDLLEFTKENWSSLGPKIQDKIYIWMGDMDNFYLNNSLRALEEFLSKTSNPQSNAEIVFSPMKGHCSEYSHRNVLEKIHKRMLDMEETNGYKR